MIKQIRLLALAGLLAAGGVMHAQTPKREFRSVWVAGMNIDWPKDSKAVGTTASAREAAQQELRDYLDNFKRQNYTGVCVHVRPRADAYYKSTLEPWSGDLTGTRGKDPGWDPLAFAIEECHKRGMECYAWVNPFRIDHHGNTYTTDFDKKWIADGWTIRSGNWLIFNPGLPAARKHCMDVIKEIYENYAIDGMLFDDYFYPGDGMPGAGMSGTDADSDDYDLWEASKSGMSLYDWRRNNVNTFVKELYDEIQKTRPDMRFGIGPAGISKESAEEHGFDRVNISAGDYMYAKIYCDPLAWLRDGSIDFVSPQIYWATTRTDAPFTPLAEWWSMVADHYNRHNYISMASYKINTDEFGGNNTKGWAEVSKQVDIARSTSLNNAPGAIYYNANSINGPGYTGLGDYLGEHSYTRPALVPPVDWKGHVNYDAPANVSYADGTLSWKAVATEGLTIMRYTVYAVPSSVSMEEAQAGDGDGIDGEYLLDVTYSSEYTIPEDKRTGYWYAVCVYDGYGIESECATANYSSELSQAPELVAPAEGAVAGWETTFSWKAVPEATYTFTLAADAAFTKLIAQERNISVTEAKASFDGIADNTVCYWRVGATQPGKLMARSEVRTVLSPSRIPAPKPVLTFPTDGTETEEAELTFRWQCDGTGVDAFRLEIIAAGESFDKPLYSSELPGTQREASVYAYRLGVGSFDWRVVATGTHCTDMPSASSRFEITKLDVGTEPGYVVKNDNGTYAKQGDLVIENLWMRSSQRAWNNMTFANNGSLNRSMAATRTHVYVSGRSANSATADIHLSEYSAVTGEHLRDIQLSDEGKVPYFPCNNVFKDSEDNILVSNLTLNNLTTPMVIHSVDLNTGKLTEVASLTGVDGRIDHADVVGDVTTGNFTVIAAVASGSNIATWTVTNGVPGKVRLRSISSFYPSTAVSWGVAPRVHAISESEAYVDGSGTMWTLYNLTAGRVRGSFAANAALAPTEASDNGGVSFDLNGRRYNVYSYQSTYGGSRFKVTATDAADLSASNIFEGMKDLWTIPEKGLGTVNSGSCSAPCDAVVTGQGTANIFVYTPGNGLAAYRLTDTAASGVEDAVLGSEQMFVLTGRDVVTAVPCATIEAFTATGALVATAADASRITLPAAGTYIVRADGYSRIVTVK